MRMPKSLKTCLEKDYVQIEVAGGSHTLHGGWGVYRCGFILDGVSIGLGSERSFGEDVGVIAFADLERWYLAAKKHRDRLARRRARYAGRKKSSA